MKKPKFSWLFNFFIILLCSVTEHSFVASERNKLNFHYVKCNSSETIRQQSNNEFTSKIVDDEYIVIFKNYHKKETREEYIKEALVNFKNWKILSRNNFATKYPSDFDIVEIKNNNDVDRGLDVLKNHPAVRRVIQQKLFSRSLKYYYNNEDYKHFKRKTSDNVRNL